MLCASMGKARDAMLVVAVTGRLTRLLRWDVPLQTARSAMPTKLMEQAVQSGGKEAQQLVKDAHRHYWQR